MAWCTCKYDKFLYWYRYFTLRKHRAPVLASHCDFMINKLKEDIHFATYSQSHCNLETLRGKDFNICFGYESYLSAKGETAVPTTTALTQG